MSNDTSKTIAVSGIGFFKGLTLLFIGLKLTNFINWSWLWVLSPLWLPVTIVLVIAMLCLIISAIANGGY